MPTPTKTKTKKAAPQPPSKASQAGKTAIKYDLDSLAERLGPADKAFADRTFRRVPEEDLVAEGTRTDSQNILDDMPLFVGSTIEILAALPPERKKLVKLPDAMLPLILQESLELRKAKADHEANKSEAAGDKADRETTARLTLRSGISQRDLAYDGLRNALGDARMAEVDAIVGRADTPENLALGLEALARFIEKTMKADPDDALSLTDYDVGAACAEALRQKANEVRETAKVTAAPGRRVTQRALDLQDGRVLYAIEKVLRAFRAAHRANASILVPKLNKLAWMFETRSGKSKAADSSAKKPAESKPA